MSMLGLSLDYISVDILGIVEGEVAPVLYLKGTEPHQIAARSTTVVYD